MSENLVGFEGRATSADFHGFVAGVSRSEQAAVVAPVEESYPIRGEVLVTPVDELIVTLREIFG